VILPNPKQPSRPPSVTADFPDSIPVACLELDTREQVRVTAIDRPQLVADGSRRRVESADELPVEEF
jgi:hypothetical protein